MDGKPQILLLIFKNLVHFSQGNIKQRRLGRVWKTALSAGREQPNAIAIGSHPNSVILVFQQAKDKTFILSLVV